MIVYEMNVADLIPYANNPRNNDGAVNAVAESIKQFGFKVPIIVDSNNVIIAGHTRLKAAQELGLSAVPCVIADDLTEDQIKAFRLADNKVAEIAGWDFNALDKELAEIEINMAGFGFDINEFSPDEFGTDFTLPDGEKSEIVTMTFTLHRKQKELIDYAIEQCANDVEETFGNTNKNGNGLYEVVREWAEQRR